MNRIIPRPMRALAALSCLSVSFAATHAYAAGPGQRTGAAAPDRFDWSARAGLDYSDNIRRTDVNPESQTVAQGGLDLSLDMTRPHFSTNVDAGGRVNDYLNNAYKTEFLGALDGVLVYSPIPQRFSWLVQDNYGSVARDPRAVETPDNRQNLNYFTTGPDLQFHFGPRTNLRFEGRYSDVQYEASTSDQDRARALVELRRLVASKASWSLQVSTTNVDYKLAALGQYDVDEAVLGFDATGARTDLSLGAGYTRLRRDTGDDSGLLARAALTRKVGTRSQVTIGFGTQFADTADVFQLDQTARGIVLGNGEAAVSNDPYRMDYADLIFGTQGARADISFYASYRKEDHETLPAFNRKYSSARLDLTRRFTPRVSASLGAGYSNNQFGTAGIELKEKTLDAAIRWNIAETWGLQGGYAYLQGDGTGSSRNYRENRAFLGIVYATRR